ncbi:MAG: sodium:calcium antiporter [Nitrospirota bacterium]|nr:sodium:calcium antiporter [Nitrospirota bacterium]
MLIEILLFVSSLAIILVGCHVFTNGVEWLGKRLGVADGVVGSIFAGVGTALPETMIPIMAIFFGTTESAEDIGIGAIIGAPLMLSTLSLPLAALGVFVFTRMGRREPSLNLDTRQIDLELRLFLLAFSCAMGAAFIPHHGVKIGIAVFLVLLYGYYVKKTVAEEANIHEEELPPLMLAPGAAEPSFLSIWGQIFLALTAIVGGAHLFVGAVEELSVHVGIPALILSLLITPIATELPEKMNSLIWLYQRKDQMAIGNITGAMMFQATFPVTVGLLGTPWQLDQRIVVAGGLSILSVALLLIFLRLRGGLAPIHLAGGGLLYAAYAFYVLH